MLLYISPILKPNIVNRRFTHNKIPQSLQTHCVILIYFEALILLLFFLPTSNFDKGDQLSAISKTRRKMEDAGCQCQSDYFFSAPLYLKVDYNMRRNGYGILQIFRFSMLRITYGEGGSH